jgi:hypothetical protein
MHRDTQLIARVTLEQKVAFEDYARKLGLTAAVLLRMLIVRESHQKQLLSANDAARSARANLHRTRRDGTVPVRLEMSEDERFEDYAIEIRLPKSVAAACLVVRELEEQWLLRAVLAPVSAESPAEPEIAPAEG